VDLKWEDLQFRYSLKREGNLLKYEKRLRWGGSIPHGPVGLAQAVKDRSEGKPQEGEVVAAIDLTQATSVSIRKVPYAGYSAYRKPVAIFGGAAVAGLGCWLLPASFYEGWRFWVSLFPVFLATALSVEWALSRLFPHAMLVIQGNGFAAIDVEALATERRDELLHSLKP